MRRLLTSDEWKIKTFHCVRKKIGGGGGEEAEKWHIKNDDRK